MFDRIILNCLCGKELEFQSKSGECLLNNYNKDDLPPHIAVGIDGDILKCQFCNRNLKLICDLPNVVKIKLQVVKDKALYPGNHNPKHPDSIKRAKELSKVLNG